MNIRDIDEAYRNLQIGTPRGIEAGLQLLSKLAESNPHSSKVWFEYAGAFDFLGRGIERFPKYRPLQAFLALTQYSSGQAEESAKALFELVLEVSPQESMDGYQRALRNYVADIDIFPDNESG